MTPGLFDRLYNAMAFPNGEPAAAPPAPAPDRKKPGRKSQGRTRHTVAIWLDQSTKVRLLKHKHGNDTWLDVVIRLLDFYEKNHKED